MPLPATLTTQEMAKLFGVSHRRIIRWWHEGMLPEPFDMDARGANCRWLTKDIERYLPDGADLEPARASK